MNTQNTTTAKQAAHTPGPWRYRLAGIIESDDRTIGTVFDRLATDTGAARDYEGEVQRTPDRGRSGVAGRAGTGA
jgi:hypothetical protein